MTPAETDATAPETSIRNCAARPTARANRPTDAADRIDTPEFATIIKAMRAAK